MGSPLGRVRIGHKAPDFRCDAVVKGLISEVTLSTYIQPTPSFSPDCPSSQTPNWLLLLFIPAAFSFVCPTEVLAFQNCLDEFADRNCSIVFVSVDTKHALWHWQNVPREYGGLGGAVDIALLSDATHYMSRAYGVLIEEEGVCLRGMFLLDGNGIVQHATINNLTVGRSVLEALRLLEAFQAVAKHGVLCPVDWKSSTISKHENAENTTNTPSTTLTGSYDQRFENLQKEFGDLPLTDLDVKHRKQDVEKKAQRGESNDAMINVTVSSERNASLLSSVSSSDVTTTATTSTATPNAHKKEASSPQDDLIQNLKSTKKSSNSGSAAVVPSDLLRAIQSSSAPASSNPTPTQRPGALIQHSCPSAHPQHSSTGASRHSRGPTTSQPNTYSTSRGSHIVLEFADPTSSPSPSSPSSQRSPYLSYHHHQQHQHHSQHPHQPPISHPSSTRTSPTLSRSTSHAAEKPSLTSQPPQPTAVTLVLKDPASSGGSSSHHQTRLQATFEAIKKMSAGLSTPRGDSSPRKSGSGLATSTAAAAAEKQKQEKEEREKGYFDVAVAEEADG